MELTQRGKVSESLDVRRSSIKDQLEQRALQNKEQGETIKRLQELFKKNPDLQETLDILRTVNI